ncbi:MAG: hypothetical protein LBU51_03405 [Bacteroidales bacterium]|jgi:L-asparagine transporter-like permease|nr:hypothetical protein [Bacteroidales bacterium]
MSKIAIKKYSYRLIIFSIAIAALSVIAQLIFPQYITSAIPFIVIFFFFITLFTLYIVLRSDTQKAKKSFVSGYMLSRIIKFFSCLLFLFCYILIRREDAIPFAIAFLTIYFCYSVFEVYLLKKEQEAK